VDRAALANAVRYRELVSHCAHYRCRRSPAVEHFALAICKPHGSLARHMLALKRVSFPENVALFAKAMRPLT
jgi:putative component of membrane protein insertase Oxa1/YidC/SpoIIIJ protein YidD